MVKVVVVAMPQVLEAPSPLEVAISRSVPTSLLEA